MGLQIRQKLSSLGPLLACDAPSPTGSYRILGACNPQFASRAIAAEPLIGALLPCNVVVRQDAAGAVHIEVMDPNAVLTLVDQPDVVAMAAEVRQKLAQALAAV